jgi:Cysteine rich repeat
MRLSTAAASLLLAFSFGMAVPAFSQEASPPPGSQGGPARPMAHAPAKPEVKAARQALRQACTADYKTLCGNTEVGGGKVMQCLKDNRKSLSAGCQDAWQRLRAVRQASRE